MKQCNAALVLLCALAVAGCASAPVQYYTLLPAATAVAPGGPAAGGGPMRIEVLPVDVPEMLDRPQIVVRQGTAGVAVLDRARWASPMSDELRAALSAELATQLGAREGAGAARAAGEPVWRIKVEVRRIDAWPGQQVQLAADWTARSSAAGAVRLGCSSRIAQPAPADTPGLAVAHQQAVQRLAQDIAQALRQQAC